MPDGEQAWLERCARCGRQWRLTDLRWACSCGGLLDFEPAGIDPIPEVATAGGMWRYRAALPPGGVSLGEQVTAVRSVEPGVWLKLDQNLPTGSFKARGAATMLGVAAGLGVDRVVVDSSGNAGKAVAAYAEAAGIRAEVFVPESTDPSKVSFAEEHGAAVVVVPGDRSEATRAALRRVTSGGGWYASHAYQPAFHHGVKTLAFELFEQVPGVEAGTVVVPAGNGTLVLGLWLGFRQLQACGRITRIPSLVAVQARRRAPLAGMTPSGPTRAVGIAVPNPPRAGQVRAAVLASRGRVVVVDEEAIAEAQETLARVGVVVEPTAAVGGAGMATLDRSGIGLNPPVVIVITGR